MVRALKGSLAQSVTSCIDRIKHFKAKYPSDDDTETSTVKIVMQKTYWLAWTVPMIDILNSKEPWRN